MGRQVCWWACLVIGLAADWLAVAVAVVGEVAEAGGWRQIVWQCQM